MKTFDVKRDIVMDEYPWIIADEAAVKAMEEEAKKLAGDASSKVVAEKVKFLKELRKENTAKIKTVTVTVKSPTPEDLGIIREKSVVNGSFNSEKQPFEAVEHLVKSWDLVDEGGEAIPCTIENIRQRMPNDLHTAVWYEIYWRLYPTEARIGFLGQLGA